MYENGGKETKNRRWTIIEVWSVDFQTPSFHATSHLDHIFSVEKWEEKEIRSSSEIWFCWIKLPFDFIMRIDILVSQGELDLMTIELACSTLSENHRRFWLFVYKHNIASICEEFIDRIKCKRIKHVFLL